MALELAANGSYRLTAAEKSMHMVKGRSIRIRGRRSRESHGASLQNRRPAAEEGAEAGIDARKKRKKKPDSAADGSPKEN